MPPGAVLNAAGLKVMTFLVLCTAMWFFEDLVLALLGLLVGLEMELALMTGLVSMIGGHGVSGGIAPFAQASSVVGVETVAHTSAALGLVAGSLSGGALADCLILKHQLHMVEASEVDFDESVLQTGLFYLRDDLIMHAFIMILLAMFVGSFITDGLNRLVGAYTEKPSFLMYLDTMLVAVFLRYLNDHRTQREYHELVPTVGLGRATGLCSAV